VVANVSHCQLFSDVAAEEPTKSAVGEKGEIMTDEADDEAPSTMATGGKLKFTSLEDAQMRAKMGPTVLFFYAGWSQTP